MEGYSLVLFKKDKKMVVKKDKIKKLPWRPIKFTFEIIYNDTLEFLNILLEESKVLLKIINNTEIPYKRIKILTFNELLMNKPYSKETYYSNLHKYTSESYKQENPELLEKIEALADSKKKINNILEQIIVNGAMTNKYNPTFSIFNLKNNYGWKDKVETENVNKNLNIEIDKDKIKEEAEKLRKDLENV